MEQKDFIQELKYWMEKAREADPKFQVFGSETHKYRFEKPVSLEKVRAFDVSEALKMFDAYFYGEHPEIAVQVCRWMPEKEKERYYLRAVEVLNTPELAGRLIWNGAFQKEEPCAERMLFFLDYCRCKRAADIVNYALAAETPQECRRTAIFVMSHCADIAEYEAEMAAWMRDEDYWIAHAALQGSIDAKLKGKVIRETYRWMRKRYKDDSVMQANLAHVAWII